VMQLSKLLRYSPFKVHRFFLNAREISSESATADTPSDQFCFRELTPADLPLFARMVDEATLSTFRERFDRGERCFRSPRR